MGLVVVLELAAVEVARGAKILDLLLRHLLAGGLERRAVELTDLLEALLVALLLLSWADEREGGQWARGGGDVRPREARERSGAGGLIRGERTWVTKKMGMPRPAPRPMKAATPIVMVSSSSSASWASSTACEGNRAGGRAGQIDRDRDRRARVWSEGDASVGSEGTGDREHEARWDTTRDASGERSRGSRTTRVVARCTHRGGGHLRAAARAESDGGGRPGGGHADGLARAARRSDWGGRRRAGGDNVTRDGGHHNLSVDASVGDQKSVARRRRGPRERGKTCGHWIETSQQVHI